MFSALHAFSTRAADKPTNNFVNPPIPQDFTPSVSPDITPFTDSDQPPDDSAWQDIKSDLKFTKDALMALQQRFSHYDGQMSNLASQVDLFKVFFTQLHFKFCNLCNTYHSIKQGQITAVRTESKSSIDQATSDLLDRLVEAKLGGLISQLSQQTGLTLDNVGATVILLNEALSELKELKNWKQNLGPQNGNLTI